MKKNRIILICSIAALLATGCNSGEDDNVTLPDPVDMTFNASLQAVTDGPEALFASGDAITVYDQKSGKRFVTSGSGNAAEFNGQAIPSDRYSAVYPALDNTFRYSGKFNATIPSDQGQRAGEMPEGAIAIAHTSGTDLSFHYVTSFLKVNIPEEEGVVSVEVSSVGEEPLSGDVRIPLEENASIETSAPSSKVSLSSENALSGTYYIAVLPATLSQGYSLTAVDDYSRRATINVENEVSFVAGTVLDLGTLSNLEWDDDVENPNPTLVPGINVIKASFNRADFNMISDGGFEEVDPDNPFTGTSWQFPDAAGVLSFVEGHTGNRAARLDNPTPGIWYQLAQTTALHEGTTYQYSAYINRTTPHMYNGVVDYPSAFRNEINGPNTYVEGEGWKLYENEFTVGTDDKWGDMFMGLWGDAGAYSLIDDVKIVPKDYTASSIETSSTTTLKQMNNKTFDEVSDADKTVVFGIGEGKYVVAFSNVTVRGVAYDNAVAIAEASSLADGISIRKIVKQGVKLVPFLERGENEIAVVPNSGFAYNGKIYLHYYAKTAQDAENPDAWTVSRAGFVESSDGGLTWTKCDGEWAGNGGYVESSFCIKDGVLYMLGNAAGREASHFTTMRFARISLDKDFTNPAEWEYFNRVRWENTENADLPVCLMGSRGENAILYNPQWNRFVIIYRSGIHGGLVFRDAETIDGDWSGEKILLKDPDGVKLYAPSVLEVTDDGDITISASVLK